MKPFRSLAAFLPDGGSAVKPIRAFLPLAATRPLFRKRQQPPGAGRYQPLTLPDSPGGNVGIGLTAPAYKLDVNGSINARGTVYANGVALTSDRNAKENFTAVNAREVLGKVANLPVTQWNYKTDGKDVQHLGPMAQDFLAAFGLDGADDKHISVVDEGGVALAAIQGLNQKVEEREGRIQEQESRIQNQAAEIEALKQNLAELKQLVQSIAEKK